VRLFVPPWSLRALIRVAHHPPVRRLSTSVNSLAAGKGALRRPSQLGGHALRYPRPATTPTVEFVPQEFFNENACHHTECRVWGWYPNTDQDVVYVHEAVRELMADDADPRSLLAASIIVHEFTHYLQAAKRGFAAYQCEGSIELEREAYGVQNAYIVSYGRYMQVGVSMHNAGCGGSASESAVR